MASNHNMGVELAPVDPNDDWLQPSMQVGKIVLYSCDVATGLAQRSANSSAIIGLPAIGPAQAWSECICPEDVVFFNAALASLTPKDPLFELEYRIIHAVTGKRFWVIDRGEAIYDDGENRLKVRGAIMDINGHVRAQTDIRDSAKLLAIAAEAAKMGAWHLDFLSNRIIASEELLAMLQTNRAQYDETLDSFEKFIHPDDLSRWRAALKNALSPGGQPEFEFRIVLSSGEIRWFLSRGHIVRRFDDTPLEYYGVMIDITDRKDWEKRQILMLRELSHRVTNTLAVIQSIMRQTLRSKTDPKAFAEAFEGRISSLAASHGLLTSSEWRGGNLSEIIRNQLDGMVDDLEKRIILSGPNIVFPAEAATQLGLVLHELGTNAAKYGALSTQAGTIEIKWEVSADKLSLEWRERGGPILNKIPEQNGFGSSLIAASVSKFTREFNPDGFTCRLELAL